MKKLICILITAVLFGAFAVSAAAQPSVIPEEGVVIGHHFEMDVSLQEDTITRPTQADLRTTAAGLDFLKKHEGFVSKPYGDYGQTSFGYGTSTSYAEKYGFPTDEITQEQAHDLLVCVVYEMEQSLTAFVQNNNLNLSDAQYDALLSFTYNNGTGWLWSNYRLTRHLKNGYTKNEFASAMGIWCHVTLADGTSPILDGLVNRRLDEVVLFLEGYYDRAESPVQFCTLRYVGDGTFDNDIDFYEKGQPYGGFSEAWSKDSARPHLVGWYTADGTRITKETIVTRDLTVSPQWSRYEDPVPGYAIRSLSAQSSTGTELEKIPVGGFYLCANVYKGVGAGEALVMLVTYDRNGKMLDAAFLKADVPQDTVYSLSVWVDNSRNQVGSAKAFVLASLSDPTPLCEAKELR